MRNIIKKGLILLFLNLTLPIPVLSQTILDSTQTKILSIILTEHEKLSIENPLLKQQIKSLEELNQLYISSDSIQKIEINAFKDKIISDEKQIQKLKSAQKKTIISSSVGGIILFILGLLL